VFVCVYVYVYVHMYNEVRQMCLWDGVKIVAGKRSRSGSGRSDRSYSVADGLFLLIWILLNGALRKSRQYVRNVM
jgi:hypothetical protein